MKFPSTLFAGLFVVFFAVLACEKEDINPSPIESILGDYDVNDLGRWDNGKRMKIIKKNDSIVDIRVLINYPFNLLECSYIYKDLTIIPKRSPWLVDSVFFYIYNNSHQQVGNIRTPKVGTYLQMWGGFDSLSNTIKPISAVKRKD